MGLGTQDHLFSAFRPIVVFYADLLQRKVSLKKGELNLSVGKRINL